MYHNYTSLDSSFFDLISFIVIVIKETINKILETDKETYVVSIKGPIDYPYFKNLHNYSCLYEYSPNSIKTIIKQLKGDIILLGKLPK